MRNLNEKETAIANNLFEKDSQCIFTKEECNISNTLKRKILDEFDKIYDELLNINNSEESTEFKENWLQDFLRSRREDIEFYLDNTWHRVEEELPKEYRPVLLCYKDERNHKFTKIATYVGIINCRPRWMTSGSHVLIILDKCTEVCWTEIPAPPNDNFFVKGGGDP